MHKVEGNQLSRSPSVISCHKLEYKQEFDWKLVEILNREPYLITRGWIRKRIKRQNVGLNKQSATRNFYQTYIFLYLRYSLPSKDFPLRETPLLSFLFSFFPPHLLVIRLLACLFQHL